MVEGGRWQPARGRRTIRRGWFRFGELNFPTLEKENSFRAGVANGSEFRPSTFLRRNLSASKFQFLISPKKTFSFCIHDVLFCGAQPYSVR
jgi:hypothetical protein